MHKAIGVLYLMYLSHVTLTKEKKKTNPHIVRPNIHWNVQSGWWWSLWKCNDGVLFYFWEENTDGSTVPLWRWWTNQTNVQRVELLFPLLCCTPFSFGNDNSVCIPVKKKKKTLSSCWKYLLRWLSIFFKLEFHLHSTFTPSSFKKVFFFLQW